MTWAQLIREYYKLCIESGCALDLSLDDLEPGASGAEKRMMSYDNYKDPDMVIESNIKQLIDSVKEN